MSAREGKRNRESWFRPQLRRKRRRPPFFTPYNWPRRPTFTLIAPKTAITHIIRNYHAFWGSPSAAEPPRHKSLSQKLLSSGCDFISFGVRFYYLFSLKSPFPRTRKRMRRFRRSWEANRESGFPNRDSWFRLGSRLTEKTSFDFFDVDSRYKKRESLLAFSLRELNGL